MSVDILFAIFAFTYIFNLLPFRDQTPKVIVNVLALCLIVWVVFGPVPIHHN